jgi:oligopeptide/dipeptide ABC transporter ATP-binding protein
MMQQSRAAGAWWEVGMALLEVRDLRVHFDTDDGVVKAVDGVNFSLDPGQTLGIVGESGSGKSVTNLAIMGLARGGRITGEVLFEGRDLLKLHTNELREIRGKKIAMIFQDPLSSLHPYYKVGAQIAEMILAHEKVSKKDARDRAINLLRLVGIPKPERRVDDFPHQFSGGMRQRAMIAMALALDPAVLIADEPTTALDVTVQAQVLDLIERLQEEFGTAIVVITHDLGVVADMADDVLVMYGGKPVEVADRRTAYYNPHMPYTWGLLQSLPPVAAEHTGDQLRPIKGQPPSLINLPKGCSFNPRCPYVMEVCTRVEPELEPADPAKPSHLSACHLSLEDKERIWEQEVAPTR